MQTVATTVAVGSRPRAVAVNPVTNKIYVVNHYSKDVKVIDGATNATPLVAAGNIPSAVALNAGTNKIFVVRVGLYLSSLADAAVHTRFPAVQWKH